MSEMKLTGLDASQIPRYTYDEENNANRMILVGDFGIGNAIKEQLKDLKIELPEIKMNESKEVQKIEVPVIIKEKELQLERIEVPVIVTQTEIKVIEIEKPVIVKEFEKIEVPVVTIQKEIQIIEVDKLNYKLLYIMQAITLVLIIVSKFIK